MERHGEDMLDLLRTGLYKASQNSSQNMSKLPAYKDEVSKDLSLDRNQRTLLATMLTGQRIEEDKAEDERIEKMRTMWAQSDFNTKGQEEHKRIIEMVVSRAMR